jgi:large conductance mechanosensitive channel
MPIIADFEKFIARGNVLDLAVAFVMGAAFNTLVTALVNDIVSPAIGIPGHVDFAGITYTINGSTFLVGAFINSLIAFLTISIAVFFFIVRPVSKLLGQGGNKASPPPTKSCPYCESSIPKGATRCPFCTSRLGKNARA